MTPSTTPLPGDFRRSAPRVTLARARRARALPPGFRAWLVATCVAFAGQLLAWAPAAIAVAGTLLAWQGLTPLASTYRRPRQGRSWERRRHRTLSFAAGLAVAAAFLIGTILSLGWLWRDETWRNGGIVLAAAGVGCACAVCLVRGWWRVSYLVFGGLGMLAAGVGGIALGSGGLEPPLTIPDQWLQATIRILLILTLVDIFARSVRRGRAKQGWPALAADLLLTPFVAALLGAIHHAPGWVAEASRGAMFGWVGVAIVLLVAMVLLIAQARVPLLEDLRWLDRQWRSPLATPHPAPLGFFLALAFLPALLLAPIAAWDAWWVTLGLGFVAGVFRLLADKLARGPLRFSVRRRAPIPEPPLNGLTLES